MYNKKFFKKSTIFDIGLICTIWYNEYEKKIKVTIKPIN